MMMMEQRREERERKGGKPRFWSTFSFGETDVSQNVRVNLGRLFIVRVNDSVDCSTRNEE